MHSSMFTRRLGATLLAASIGMLSACATNGTADDRDPLEGLNRKIHGFNTTFDETIGKPLATGYKNVTPTPVNKGITNFFSNINEVVVIINDLLQLKVGQAAADTGRMVANSTFGILGFIDVATSVGLEKHDEDLGQTMGHWGLGTGPYLVLPFIGPSDFRDTVGWVGDTYIDPLNQLEDVPTRNALRALKLLDLRADLLSATNIVETAALDQYSFVRDAYLQRRNYLVFDGNPPPERYDDQ